MKTYGGVEVQLQAFFPSSLDGGEWSGSRTSRFNPLEKNLRHPLDGRVVGPRRESGWGGEEKKIHPLPEMERLSSSP
jgi:hypothetical protein